MSNRFVPLDEAEPADAVVVIDVLRAFTTAAWAFDRGARRLLAVSGLDEALALRAALPDALVAGEQGGRRPAGFDLGNSPAEIAPLALAGRTIVHRTSAGTQGLARTLGSEVVLAASFVNAAATAERLRSLGRPAVTYVITGASHGRDGDEDLACAELIAARVDGADPDTTPFLERVATSDAGQAFGDPEQDWATTTDLALACEVDRFRIAMVAGPADDAAAVEVVGDVP